MDTTKTLDEIIEDFKKSNDGGGSSAETDDNKELVKETPADDERDDR